MVRIQPGPFKRPKNAGDVAQLGERLVCNQKVGGSNPLVSSEVFIGEVKNFLIEPKNSCKKEENVVLINIGVKDDV